MKRRVARAFIVGIGDTGASVLSKMRDRFLWLSDDVGMPVISLMTVEDGDSEKKSMPGENISDPQPISRFFISRQSVDESRSAFLPPDAQELVLASESNAEGKAPGSTRLMHSVKFFSSAPLLEQHLRDMVLRVVDAQTAKALDAMGMEMRSDAHLDVFVIGDLGDPFASSMLVDLPYLIQHVAESQLVEERVSKNYVGMWFLPVFPISSDEAIDVNERREKEQWRAATTYAALKELDFFMDQGRYEKTYDPGLRIVAKDMAPYNYVYLVDSVNESSQRIPTLSQMAEMVSEWMYLALTTKMGEEIGKHVQQAGNIRSYGKLAAYSGLGLAAYMLPIEELIEAEAQRLGVDMLGDKRGLLYKPPEDVETGLFFNVSKEEIEGRLRSSKEGENCEKTIKSYTKRRDEALRNIAPYDLRTFFERIKGTFEYNYTERLRNIGVCLSNNLSILLEDEGKEIRDRALKKVDEIYIGGIALAFRGVRALGERVEEQLEETRRNLQRLNNESNGELKKANEALTASQAAHVASVYAFHPENLRERIAVWSGLVLFGILSFWLSITSFLFAKDNLVGLIEEWRGEDIGLFYRVALQVATFLFLVAAVVAVGIGIFTAFQWWDRTRKSYIESHSLRLTKALEKTTTEMRLHFFEGIRDSIRGITADIVDLRDKVEEIRDTLQKRVDEPHALYGSPRLILEESVLQEGDVEELYQEVVGDSVEDEIRDFAQEDQYGAISRWVDMPPERIARMILEFSKAYMEQLREETDAETLLEKHAKPSQPLSPRFSIGIDKSAEDATLRTVQEKMRKLIDDSKPFLRYSRTAIESSVAPSLVQVIGFLRAGEEKSVIRKAVEQIRIGYGSTIVTSQISDRHRIISMSARHGLPLSAIGMLSSYKEQYNRLKVREKGLHLTTDYLMLPDLFPLRYEGETILDPQEAVALGLAFNKVRWNSRKEVYEFRYLEDELGKKVTAALGKDKVMAAVYLQEHVGLLAILSKQIFDAMDMKARTKMESGDKDQQGIENYDSRLVSEFLDSYLRRKRRSKKGKLEDWEALVIKKHIHAWSR